MTVRGYWNRRILTVMDTPEREDRDRTGRPARFTTEDAIAAALDLGIADFSLARVAHRLGVSTPALYRLFPSRDALVEECLRYIFGRVDAPKENVPWRTLLEDYGMLLWKQFTTYPRLHEIFANYPKPPRHYFPGLNQLYALLTEQGFTRGQAIYATAYLFDMASSVVGMMQRQQSHLAALAPNDPPEFFTPEGAPVTTPDEITALASRQYRSEMDFFLDHMADTAPDWPAWVGAYQVF